MTNSPFILVCHPHRSPGFAIPYENEQAFVDCWVNGVLDVRCNCRADNSSTATYDSAIEDVGHDMHHVTRLDSRAEYDDYMAGACHNKATEDDRHMHITVDCALRAAHARNSNGLRV